MTKCNPIFRPLEEGLRRLVRDTVKPSIKSSDTLIENIDNEITDAAKRIGLAILNKASPRLQKRALQEIAGAPGKYDRRLIGSLVEPVARKYLDLKDSEQMFYERRINNTEFQGLQTLLKQELGLEVNTPENPPIYGELLDMFREAARNKVIEMSKKTASPAQ